MIKTVFCYLILLATCNSSSCELSESELKTILSVFYFNNILEEHQDEINLNIEDKNELEIPGRVELQNKRIIKTNSEKKGIPYITLGNFQSYDTGIVKVKFKVLKSARRYSGEIVLKCIDNNLIFKDIHYLSEID